MSNEEDSGNLRGRIFNIQRYSTEDGPGIRSTVFLKGCPLTCLWCANPESQKSYPQVGHRDALCKQCGNCMAACTEKAISFNPDGKESSSIEIFAITAANAPESAPKAR